jgi:hypothetical protein
MSATLYRFYDANGQLLYVGATGRGIVRVQAHESKPWWPSVDVAAFEHFPTLEECLAAETEAIKSEQPIHNRHHRVADPPDMIEMRNDRRAQASLERAWHVFHRGEDRDPPWDELLEWASHQSDRRLLVGRGLGRVGIARIRKWAAAVVADAS